MDPKEGKEFSYLIYKLSIQITVQITYVWHESYIKHTLFWFCRSQLNLCAKCQLGKFDKILWKMAGFQTPGLPLL